MATVKQLVNQARKLGIQVNYRERTDGGILVTQIGSTKYTAASGNEALRRFMGESLSEARGIQLKKITPPKIRDLADEDFIKEVKNLQRQWKKVTGNKIGRGKLSMRVIKKRLKYEDKSEVKRKLTQTIRREMGLAYEKNIDALVSRLKRMQYGYNIDLSPAINAIEASRETFKDEWIGAINDICYNYEVMWQGKTPDSSDVSGLNSEIISVIN